MTLGALVVRLLAAVGLVVILVAVIYIGAVIRGGRVIAALDEERRR